MQHRILYLFSILLIIPGFSIAGVFDPVYTASKSERCQLAEDLFIEFNSKKVVSEDDISELKAFAEKKSDKCLILAALSFNARLEDSKDDKIKNEDSIFVRLKRALTYASENGFAKQEADLTYRVGMKHYHKKEYPQAFENLLKSYDKFKSFGFEKFPWMQFYLYNIGKIYYEFADYQSALPYFNQSLQFPFRNERDKIHTYNILALTHNALKNRDTSLYFYRKGLDVATSTKDSVWVGILSGNMASIFLAEGDVKSAKPLIQMDFRLSKQHREWQSVANCLLLLANINMDEDSLSAAAARIKDVEDLTELNWSKSLRRNYFHYKSRLAELRGDFKNAYAYQDSFIHYKDLVAADINQGIIRNTEVKVQTDKYLYEIQLLEDKKQRELMLRNYLISAGGLVLIILLLLFFNQRQRRKKDKALLLLEKTKAEEELKSAENALQWYMNSILEKNRLIERFKEEADELKKVSDKAVDKENEQIMDRLYEATILTEEDWTKFKRMFEKVHGDFFLRLKNKHPDLTLAEIRLLALAKLNLSVNEIANMLGISPDSVRKTGSRMRKKLNLPNQTSIAEIAADI